MSGEPSAERQRSGFRRYRRRFGLRLRGARRRSRRAGRTCLRPPTLGEFESLLTLGGPHTTPSLDGLPRRFRPRLSLWALAGAGMLYLLLALAGGVAHLRFLLPLLVVTGGMLLPLATLLFFFEANRRRDISWVGLFPPLGLGAAAALLVAFPAVIAGPVLGLPAVLAQVLGAPAQEAIKAVVLLMLLGGLRYQGTLAGLLLGAAVGTGFVMGQTLGAILALEDPVTVAVQMAVSSRGASAPAGYQVVWTALLGGALWRERGGRSWGRELLVNPGVLRAAGWAVGLHVLWVLPLGLPALSQGLILGSVSWVAVASYLRSGWQERCDLPA